MSYFKQLEELLEKATSPESEKLLPAEQMVLAQLMPQMVAALAVCEALGGVNVDLSNGLEDLRRQIEESSEAVVGAMEELKSEVDWLRKGVEGGFAEVAR